MQTHRFLHHAPATDRSRCGTAVQLSEGRAGCPQPAAQLSSAVRSGKVPRLRDPQGAAPIVSRNLFARRAEDSPPYPDSTGLCGWGGASTGLRLFAQWYLLPVGLVFGIASAAWSAAGPAEQEPIPDKITWTFRSLPRAEYHFGGLVGQRIGANVAQWLLPAPEANPGMLEMFHRRDRSPAPQLVPWAGEFVGKYLISGIQALRMTNSPALRERVQAVVTELLASQAEDGYLGPFPKEARLLGNWDLWGHYHVLEALLMWHERTRAPEALLACRRAADLMCRTYLDQPRRVFDAESQEMNMAVIHGLGWLYRLTGEPRYERLMREIEKDWERAGDYLRTGLAGLEFFQTPRPRWESLHDLQGLLELYRISGQEPYRAAFEHHWRSIVRWDRHSTGGFSTGEQAIGNPYAPGAIETCCTVAWMALTLDLLRLTGDVRAADELELSTFNGALGAQHPSGRWWTYNTPMDGVREASAHSIVFQARAGTPELNCCSVNGPRSLGMLTEWALMTTRDGLVVNYYGPAQFQVDLGNRQRIRLVQETDYPLSGHVRVRFLESPPVPFTLHLRIPTWSTRSSVQVDGQPFPHLEPGRYLSLHRLWKPGDRVELELDFAVRAVPGDQPCLGKVSLYRGPLLLAYDDKISSADEQATPAVDISQLDKARVLAPRASTNAPWGSAWPWLFVEVPTGPARPLPLCDFASAGAFGTPYRSWLPATNSPPPPPIPRQPQDAASIPAGPAWFKWTTRTNAFLQGYSLLVSDSESFSQPLVKMDDLSQNRVLLSLGELAKEKLHPHAWYYWKVSARNAFGTTDSVGPPARFKIDPALPVATGLSDIGAGPDQLLLRVDLAGDPEPQHGKLARSTGCRASPGPGGAARGAVALNGQDQMLVYELDEFPEEDFSVSLWFNIANLPTNHLGQVFSAWAASMDDPLRLVVEGGKLFARVEAGQGYSTQGISVQVGRWYHVAAVKSGASLTLYIDGKPVGTTTAPAFIATRARTVALGGNPNYSGPEFLAAAFASCKFFGRALAEQENSAEADFGKSRLD
jgi:DUF1680 family protein